MLFTMCGEGRRTGLGIEWCSSARSARALVVRKMSSSAITIGRATLMSHCPADDCLAADRDLAHTGRSLHELLVGDHAFILTSYPFLETMSRSFDLQRNMLLKHL